MHQDGSEIEHTRHFKLKPEENVHWGFSNYIDGLSTGLKAGAGLKAGEQYCQGGFSVGKDDELILGSNFQRNFVTLFAQHVNKKDSNWQKAPPTWRVTSSGPLFVKEQAAVWTPMSIYFAPSAKVAAAAPTILADLNLDKAKTDGFPESKAYLYERLKTLATQPYIDGGPKLAGVLDQLKTKNQED